MTPKVENQRSTTAHLQRWSQRSGKHGCPGWQVSIFGCFFFKKWGWGDSFSNFPLLSLSPMSKRPDEVDSNIIAALNRLKWPLPSARNTKIAIREKCRNQPGIEHIASKRHHLKVDDVPLVPTILAQPIVLCKHPGNKHHLNYYGKRKGNRSPLFLKIVTMQDKSDSSKEWIVTIYPTKKVK